MRTEFLLISAAIIIGSASTEAQTPFPAVPPKDVTSNMDHDQMLWQLGITLPVLPSRLQDPDRPSDARPADKNNPEGNWTNDKKYTYIRSAWGLWNNYSDRSSGFFPGPDSARLGDYTPINLLRMKDGTIIKSAEEWWSQRRPEILKDVQEQMYGIIPPDSILPKVTWIVSSAKGVSGSMAYIQKDILGNIDISRYPEVRNRPQILATLRTPANATGPVPVMIIFGGFGNVTDLYWTRACPEGWGICTFNLTALQPDNGAGLTSYLIGLVNKGNWRKPTDWGTLAAWGWGVSRLIDYMETDKDVNAKIIGLTGHSRYGKATLVTMAYEPRVAIGFPSDAGSLGTKMNRRHWGQDLEHSTGSNEYHWMAGTFFKWAGELVPGHYLPRKIEECPVDAHSLVALCAPRPLLINGGNSSSWCDPYGMYLTAYNASPVYILLGVKGVVMNDPKPVIDKAYIDGTIAYRYHNGGHTDAPEWPSFFEFAARHFDIPYLSVSNPALILGAKDNLKATFGVSSDREWKVTSSASWLSFDSHSSTGKDSVTITAKPNKGKARTAQLTITAKGWIQTVTVNQNSARPSLKLTVKDIVIDSGNKGTFNIISRNAWSISGLPAWLTADYETGINNRTITLTAAQNPLVQKRTTTLMVTSPGLEPQKIKVMQNEGPATLNISALSLTIDPDDKSTASVMIISNTTWTLKCSETWLSANSESGEGFRQVVFTAGANNGTTLRKASVTVTVPGMDPRVVEVVQKAKE